MTQGDRSKREDRHINIKFQYMSRGMHSLGNLG